MSKTRRNQAGYRPKSGHGKGDFPRNLGQKFRDNYDDIFRKRSEKEFEQLLDAGNQQAPIVIEEIRCLN